MSDLSKLAEAMREAHRDSDVDNREGERLAYAYERMVQQFLSSPAYLEWFNELPPKPESESETLEKAVFLGGPSHGEIVTGRYHPFYDKVVTGPQPVWWNRLHRFEHYYKPTGKVVDGKLIYEYIGMSKAGEGSMKQKAINEGVRVPVRIFSDVQPGGKFRVILGDAERYGFRETWSIQQAGELIDSLARRGYIVVEITEDGTWMVERKCP
jgi:hypothetical protein